MWTDAVCVTAGWQLYHIADTIMNASFEHSMYMKLSLQNVHLLIIAVFSYLLENYALWRI